MVTRQEVLTAYNTEHGSNLTFAELGAQLAMNELRAFYRKMQIASVSDEIL